MEKAMTTSNVTSDIRRRLGSILRTKRTAKSLSQTALAQQVGLSRPTVAHIELGKQECGLEAFVRIARALDEQPHELLKRLVLHSAKLPKDPWAADFFSG